MSDAIRTIIAIEIRFSRFRVAFVRFRGIRIGVCGRRTRQQLGARFFFSVQPSVFLCLPYANPAHSVISLKS